MEAKVVLRVVAAATADFVDLDEGFVVGRGLRCDLNPCADAGAIGFGADGADLDPVAVRVGVAAKELREALTQLTTTSRSPSLSKSPKAEPRAGAAALMPGPPCR